ncbi:uncharacterized protein LOC143446844 isoform X1 [Clavelina lepadiformis]|uniref:uncharacterized protein LOC143446844 isoform X1 n=2 Tax=Clavelina lepadiformis TaxID=159417 RepID=UPI004041BC10
MKTIEWGLVQIPLVECYRVCFCWKRPLPYAVSGSGWKLFVQSTVRLLLLVLWGMPKIDFELPQTHQFIIGLYVEIGMLGVQVCVGMATIVGSWFENMKFLYPFLVVVPLSFLVDFFVKATCYGPLFLFPEVTGFGVFSLVEVWWRNLTQMYCWIAIVSFIYTSKGKENPFQVKKDPDGELGRAPSMRTPFSRSSTLSRRGRRSFLLKSKPEEENVTDDASLLRRSESSSESAAKDLPKHVSSSLRHKEKFRQSDDDRSTLLARKDETDSTAPPSVGPSERTGTFSPEALRSLSDDFSFQRQSELGVAPSQPRYKRVGGFVPDVLRTASNAEDLAISEQFSPVKVKDKRRPPTLPRQPPAGAQDQRNKWKKGKGVQKTPSFRPDQSVLV